MLNRFDRKLKRKIQQNPVEIPEDITKAVNQTLAGLSQKERRAPLRFRPRSALITAAALAAVTLLILPNINANIAHAMEQLPVIGAIVRVVTIREYSDQSDYHDLTAEIPSVEVDGNSSAEDAARYINASVEELTETLIASFYKDAEQLGIQAHTAMRISYDILTNNDAWFTLKLNLHFASGSSNTSYKLYHIDKKSGKIVQLSDLFAENSDYVSAISTDIRRQMSEQMQQNEDLVYWLDAEYPEWNFSTIQDNQNFYFAENGNIVILFDKYEVSPGFMGTPKIEISKEVYAHFLKDEYK